MNSIKSLHSNNENLRFIWFDKFNREFSFAHGACVCYFWVEHIFEVTSSSLICPLFSKVKL